MIINEPECIMLKRIGAKHVSELLSGKSKQDKLEFWSERTQHLISQQKKRSRASLN
jgi:hypothetical protein